MNARNGTNASYPVQKVEELYRDVDAKVAEIMEKVPDIKDALGKVPAGSALKAIYGTHKFFVDPTNTGDVQTLVLIGVLQKQIEELRAELDELKGKAEIVVGAERNWHFSFVEGNNLVFSNAIGEYALLPIDVGHAIFSKRRPDCRLKRGKRAVSFFRRGPGGKRVARMPRALFAIIGKVLESVPWASLAPGASVAPRSGPRAPEGRSS